jgi:hypothetical protein
LLPEELPGSCQVGNAAVAVGEGMHDNEFAMGTRGLDKWASERSSVTSRCISGGVLSTGE